MSGDEAAAGSGSTRCMVIANERGLHARAAAKFVAKVQEFDADVSVSKDGMSVSGRSIMGLMMLAAAAGSTIEVSASGPDALAVLDGLEVLIANGFDE
jgi:phosphocarrier protein HPr